MSNISSVEITVIPKRVIQNTSQNQSTGVANIKAKTQVWTLSAIVTQPVEYRPPRNVK